MTKYDISLTYDVLNRTTEITKNNVPIDMYSALGHYANRDFSNWFETLCSDAYREVNTDFSISFCGPELYSIMLRHEAAASGYCNSYTDKPWNTVISRNERLDWLNTLAKISPDVSYLTDSLSVHLCADDSIMAQLDSAIRGHSAFSGSSGTYQYRFSPAMSIPVSVSSFSSRPESLKSSLCVTVAPAGCNSIPTAPSGSAHSITYAIDPAASGSLEYIGRMSDNSFAFSGPQNMLAGLIEMAMDALVLPQLYVSASSCAKACRAVAGHSDPKVRLMPSALASNTPVCTASFPSRIELNSSEPVSITVLPNISIQLHLSSPNSIKCDGKTMTGLIPGTVRLDICPKDSNHVMYSCSVDIYQIFKVTSISLSARQTSVYTGDVVDVTASFYPANSVDIGTQRWTISPSGILSEQSRGHYLAHRSGSCTITVSVGRVTKSIVIQVKDSARQLVLPVKSFSMKITQPPQSLIPSMKPSSATNGTISHSVADTSVAVYDDNAKIIRPISIGTTSITFYLHTQNGIVDHQTIPVEILPPYRIENPPASLVLMILCSVLSLATIFTVASPAFTILSAICGVWHLIAKKFSLRSIITVAIFVGATVGTYFLSQNTFIL